MYNTHCSLCLKRDCDVMQCTCVWCVFWCKIFIKWEMLTEFHLSHFTFICTLTCTATQTHICTYTHTYTCILKPSVHISLLTYDVTHTHTVHKRTYTHTHTCIITHARTHTFTYTHCTHTCIITHSYTLTHTAHTHARTHTCHRILANNLVSTVEADAFKGLQALKYL